MKRLLFFILIFPFLLSAQDATIDSLKQALKNVKHDTSRVNILFTISQLCEIEDIPNYAEACIKICEKGIINPESKTLKTFYLTAIGNSFCDIGYYHDIHGDIKKALEYYTKSLNIHDGLKNKQGIAGALNNIASLYYHQGDITKALEYFHRSLKIKEEINDNQAIANALINIGLIYSNQGDNKKALEYYQRSLKLQKEINNKSGIASVLGNIGTIYYTAGNITKAEEYYFESLKIEEEIDRKVGIASSFNNLGFIFLKKNDLATALSYYHKSLKLREEMGEKLGITESLKNIANVLYNQGNLSEALIYSKRSLQIARELAYPYDVKGAAAILKEIYKKQGNYKDALEMYDLEIQMRDSINNQETRKASIKNQFQYEYEKKAAADSVKHAEEQKVKNALLTAQQAQLKQEKTQRLSLYGGLILVIAFLGFVFNRFRITQKQKVVIEQQKILVDTAFANLEEKNREVMDSIRYAKRIQTALLTNEKYIARKLNELNQ